MIAPRRRARATVCVPIAVASLAFGIATSGCARQETVAGSPVSLAGLPAVARQFEAESAEVTVFGPAAADVGAGSALLVARLSIRRGAVAVIVRDSSGTERARRVVARIGPSLVLIPVMSDGRMSVEVAEMAETGALELDIESMQIVPTVASDGVRRAAELAGAFERETGRLADPARENLVDNADFAEDDEVRGTPRNWFAYVPTTSDALTHSLHVAGMPPPSRPAAATGPVAVSEDRRYRLFVRMRVSAGPILVRVVDYDELLTLSETQFAESGTEDRDATLEFSPPPGCHGVRVQFAPVTPGSPVDFVLLLVQLEELP